MKTRFISQKEFVDDIQKSIENLLSNFRTINEGVCFTQELYPVKGNTYHNIAQMLKTDSKDRKTRALMSLLFKNVYRSEVLSGGSSEVLLTFSLKFALELLKSNLLIKKTQQELLQDWDCFVEKFKTLVQNNTVLATKKDLEEIADTICDGDKNLATACKEAMELAGLEGKIVANNTKNKHYIVELKHGYNFKLTPYKFFLKKNLWSKRDCKILAVDGFVENVSEIDNLLNECNKNKQPLVIISQGFSEEVVATLYTNFQNQKLDVIPVRLKSDLNNLNVINDIGVVCGEDPISSLKGQMLTFVKLEDLPSVDQIIITDNNTVIENSKTVDKVSEQIRGLLSKRKENQFIEDVQVLYEQRIKSLSPLIVSINLPDMSAIKSDAYKTKIDNVLRVSKSVLTSGIVSEIGISTNLTWDEIAQYPCSAQESNLIETELEKIIFKLLDDCYLAGDVVSAMSYFLGVYLSGKTIINFFCSSGFVEIVDE